MSSKSKKPTKGGSFVNDLQNLAIPFSLILAKKGLESYQKKSKAPAKNSNNSKATGGKPKAKK